MRDSSLGDFLGDDDGGDGDADSAADIDTDTDADEPDDGVCPAVSTYDWTPTGATCASCGAVVERRWRDEDDGDAGGLVCFDCKTW